MSNSTTVQLPPFPSSNGKKGPKGQPQKDFNKALAEAMNVAYKAGKIWTTRGWCYALEELSGLKKSDFDAVEGVIRELRLKGLVPLDAVLEDQAREWEGFESVDYEDIGSYADSIVRTIQWRVRNYRPSSFWDDMDCFICVAVEKRDLLSVFRPICQRYEVPLANFRGSPDYLSRGKVLREFMWHWRQGRKVVVLYCGDHDPAGLRMSGKEMIDNFAAMHNTILGKEKLSFNRELFSVERFGLNKDFIDKHNIPWSDNLITGQKDKSKCNDLADPNHRDHNLPYVQDYLNEFCSYGYDDKLKCHRWFGRKVESNVLVVREEEGQELCTKAIEKYISLEDVHKFYSKLKEPRKELATIVSKRLADGVVL